MWKLSHVQRCDLSTVFVNCRVLDFTISHPLDSLSLCTCLRSFATCSKGPVLVDKLRLGRGCRKSRIEAFFGTFIKCVLKEQNKISRKENKIVYCLTYLAIVRLYELLVADQTQV